MELYEKLGIKSELLLQIQAIISKCKSVKRAYIFGSRARGDYKYNSDIDIAISGKDVSSNDFYYIEDELNKLNTAFEFDLVVLEKLSKVKLKENIEKEGIEIYVYRKS